MKEGREIRRIIREGIREGGEREKKKRSEGGERDKKNNQRKKSECEWSD